MFIEDLLNVVGKNRVDDAELNVKMFCADMQGMH